MKAKLHLVVVALLAIPLCLNAQNLLNTTTWTVGSGSIGVFGQNGTTAENRRELGRNHKNEEVVLWKATPDASSNADGGWNTAHYNIDHTKTYRLVVWLKKTNSNSGTSYFGFHSYDRGHHSLGLNNRLNTNPYFWYGDLPQLNKWYLLVGYVHGSNYDTTINYGGIYDGATGQKVRTITDYKFSPSATKLRHRAYLYYDTNTSDRQYFYAPRMELVDQNEPTIEALIGHHNYDQNLLAPHLAHWTEGTGGATGFAPNGHYTENSREIGKNHVGEDVLLWKATPDASKNADGGWNTGWYYGIDNDTSYRFSVWIKKTNSNTGATYFGFYANNYGSLTLQGAYNGNPYFFAGDLPKLNRWYLLVGYVHSKNHNKNNHAGGIYDGVTGKKVRTLTDYKFKHTASAIRHRAYLYYDNNTSDRQYFYAPRIDKITNGLPSIETLLRINENSKLIISFDAAGNQKQRFYCEEEGYCAPPAPTSRKIEDKVTEATPRLAPNPVENDNESTSHIEHRIYPNPTDGEIGIEILQEGHQLTRSISIYSTHGALVKKITIGTPRNQLNIDISDLSTGSYFIHIHFSNGATVTEKIIKN